VASWFAVGFEGGQIRSHVMHFWEGRVGWGPIAWLGFMVVVSLLVGGSGSSGGGCVMGMLSGVGLGLGSGWGRVML